MKNKNRQQGQDASICPTPQQDSVSQQDVGSSRQPQVIQEEEFAEEEEEEEEEE